MNTRLQVCHGSLAPRGNVERNIHLSRRPGHLTSPASQHQPRFALRFLPGKAQSTCQVQPRLMRFDSCNCAHQVYTQIRLIEDGCSSARSSTFPLLPHHKELINASALDSHYATIPSPICEFMPKKANRRPSFSSPESPSLGDTYHI